MKAACEIAAACVLSLACIPALAETAASPQAITTDTPEYCDALRNRLDTMSADVAAVVLSEVRSLESEGRRMCDSGETRGGILRLRRAIMMMSKSTDAEARRP